ncbi:DUF3800 domain-containing protein [Nocardia camponoti]|uniref:DUF3800 domain-containing protein n=1 Tax=Nocardia camponoti TaxID=1616106 RepID=A0A917QJT9_9NOCA|nr:DUF3800 domain-containing protein [Nocardia camponoti]GGK52605.1 hypothetical protein GCM10011591_25460 [Nocardia camponoti]
MPTTPRVWAYIDETGDRGSGPNSSPVFGMAAVIVDDLSAPELRSAVTTLRTDFGVPAGKVMSWKEHVKNHDRRKRASAVLAGVPNLHVCYVFAVKNEVDPSSYICDPVRFYNFVALETYRSVAGAARDLYGTDARLWTRYGHVRGHDHNTTDAYIRRKSQTDERIPWHMEQGLRWVSADKYLESQAADLYGGFLKAAIWPSGEFGYTESAYLMSIWHQIRASEHCVVPHGLRSMPDTGLVAKMEWFPCRPCPKIPS